MDQGAISTSKYYNLQTALKGTTEAIQVSNNVMFTGYWKSYDMMKGISKVSAAWCELSKLHTNGIW
jgi:hypothetical protein